MFSTRAGRTTLIVMATHGRRGFDRWLRGSVAEGVLRAGATPLLLCNPNSFEPDVRSRVKRILVPLDGSSLAEQVVLRRIEAVEGSADDLLGVVALDPARPLVPGAMVPIA